MQFISIADHGYSRKCYIIALKRLMRHLSKRLPSIQLTRPLNVIAYFRFFMCDHVNFYILHLTRLPLYVA